MRTNRLLLQKYLFPVLTWLGVLGLAGAAQAQNKSAISETAVVTYVLVGLVLFVLFAIVVILLYVVRLIWLLNANIAAKSAGASKEPESLWVWLKKKYITGDLLPVEQEQSLLIDHSYDGIQELDNYMPPWLRYVFWGTIAFAVVYMFNFAVLGLVKTSEQEYVAEVAAAEKQIEAYKLLAVKGINEDNVKVNDAASMKAAKAIFAQNCQACHGAAGEGGVGPNLTDEYWLHGGAVKDIFKTIKYGVPQKGMIAWQQKLQPDQIQQVASYIHLARHQPGQWQSSPGREAKQ